MIRKICCLVLLLGIVLPLRAQTKAPAYRQDAFYMVCRGSKQKLGTIATDFNLADKNTTHVGLGILENGQLTIYNVTNGFQGTALVAETLEAFQALNDLHYIGIWEFKCSKKQIARLRKIIAVRNMRTISFDMDFNPDDDDRLYCSEFCAKTLAQLSPSLHFPLAQKRLQGFYKTAIGTSILRYYPVDFFQTDTRFVKVYEHYYN